MVIDAHVHLRDHGAPGKPPRRAEDLLREMDAADVVAAVVVPTSGFGGNAFVQEQCRPHRDRLFPLYNPDFARPRETISLAERFFSADRACGVKIHPRFQGVRPADTIVSETVAWAMEHRLPVLFDCFPHGDSLDDPAQGPLAYKGVARRFPGATVVLAHAGGYRALEAFMVATASPNVVLETSLSFSYLEGSSAERDLAFAVRRLRPGRILYGSDFPEVGVGAYLDLTHRVVGELPGEQAEAFYSATARRIYGIPA